MFCLLYRDFQQQQVLQIIHKTDENKRNMHKDYQSLSNNNTKKSLILPLIEDKVWGQTYSPVRVICMVPTLWPKKKYTMKVMLYYKKQNKNTIPTNEDRQ